MDESFDPGRGVSWTTFAAQANGKIAIAGHEGFVRRANTDGTWDESFPTVGAGGPVLALRFQADGKLLIGGDFLQVDDRPCGNLTRLWAGEWSAPRITVQPTNQVANEGQSVSFSAEASGSPAPGIQWLFNGAPMLNATNSTLTIAPLTLNDAGIYEAVLTNRLGAVRTPPAALTVKTPEPGSGQFRVVNPHWRDGRFELIIPYAAAGKTFSLESKDSWDQTIWKTRATALGNDLVLILSDPVSASAQQFYRVGVE